MDEAVRRAEAGSVPVRDAQTLLLETDAPCWRPAREAALRWLASRPEFASAVLATHTQVTGLPQVGVIEEHVEGQGFACRAAIDLPDGTVNGPRRYASAKKSARQQAMLGLLGRLAGLAVPDPQPAVRTTAAHRDAPAPLLPSVQSPWEDLGRERFSAALTGLARHNAPAPGLMAELENRKVTGRLSPKDWLTVLTLTPGGEPWDAARDLALRAARDEPGLAAGIVNLLRQQVGGLPVSYSETASGPGNRLQFEVTAAMNSTAGPVTGSPQRASSKKDARHLALVSLLAAIACRPDPRDHEEPGTQLPEALRTRPNKDPRALLNQAVVAGLVSPPLYGITSSGAVTRCRVQVQMDGRLIEAAAAGATTTHAKVAAVDQLLGRLRAAYLTPDHLGPATAIPVPEPATKPAPESGPSPAPAPAPLPVPGPRARLRDAEPAWTRAADALAWALDSGCALLFHPAQPDRLLVYRCDGSPVHDCAPPDGLEPATADVVLLGPTGNVWRTCVQAWAAPLRLLLPHLAAPAPQRHPTVTGWGAVARLALHTVAAGAVIPAIDDYGRDTWRPVPGPELEDALRRAAAVLPPFAHAVTAGTNPLRVHPPLPAASAVLDALVDAVVRGPGAAVIHGEGAFAAPPAVQDPVVQRWADDVERAADPSPEPDLVLTVQDPGLTPRIRDGEPVLRAHLTPRIRDGEPVLRAHLTVRHDDTGPLPGAANPSAHQGPQQSLAGRPARRVLRRGAAAWPPLTRLAHDPVPGTIDLTGAEAAGLLGDTAAHLAAAGVHVQWPPQLADALGSYTVIGSAPGTGAPERALTMEAMLDWHWQLTIDGCDLTEEEMDQLAEAARPLVRLRDRWLLADPALLARARARHLGQLPTREALTSALAGSLLLDGALVPCRASGTLATVVTALRTGRQDSPPVALPPGLTATLRPYQQRALEWLVHLTALGFGPLLADDMGLGKTLVALAYMLHRRPAAAGPVLVVCPTSLMDTWEREAARFAPELRVVRYHGPGRRLEPNLGPGTVVVTTYGTMTRDTAALAAHSWDLVVADEAHVINSGTNRASDGIRTLPSACRLAITGTPVENRSEELWELMDWLSPGLLGTRRAFRARIGRHTERDADGGAAQLLQRITGPFVLRRLKTDPQIAADLPAKIQKLHPVTLSPEQAALYEALVRETEHDLRTRPRAARPGRVLALLQGLRKIVNDPAVYLGEPPEQAAADLTAARRRSAKLDELLRLVDTARAGGEQVIICVNYLPVGNLLAAYLTQAGHRCEFFQGSTPAAVRTRMVDDFQAGRLPVLVLSVRAGGTGLTLTAATEVIHYDSPWTGTALDQASDRAFRIGQTRTVHVRRLVAQGTVEERIEQVVAHKTTLADAVLPAGEGALADLDDHDLTALVTLGGQAR
ncbi:DEAD/DEAH box helicase [Kitasatospora sp. NPDC002551]|uniref:DEAD/DEAH box helicase n=1 Tax=Kitasatospora sp. NPDC002551 TaxID=3154539 RepID=UPI0033291D21